MNIAIGCDEAAYDLKTLIKQHLVRQGHEVADFGTHDHEPVPYPDIGIAVAEAIAQGRHERGILMCGTGIGMAISANKVDGIRAAQAHDTYSAERASRSNNAQIISLGSRVIGAELAKAIVDAFLRSTFDGGKSAAKVDAISDYERSRHASDESSSKSRKSDA